MRLSSFTAVGLLAPFATAHPDLRSRAELERHSVMSKRCAPSAAQFNRKRYEARMNKRAVEERAENSTVSITTEAPYYDVLQNDTCVLSPEITWGPYVYPNS